MEVSPTDDQVLRRVWLCVGQVFEPDRTRRQASVPLWLLDRSKEMAHKDHLEDIKKSVLVVAELLVSNVRPRGGTVLCQHQRSSSPLVRHAALQHRVASGCCCSCHAKRAAYDFTQGLLVVACAGALTHADEHAMAARRCLETEPVVNFVSHAALQTVGDGEQRYLRRKLERHIQTVVSRAPMRHAASHVISKACIGLSVIG